MEKEIKLEELDNWFDTYIEPSAEPIKEITLTLTDRGELKNSISFSLEGVDNITFDIIEQQIEKLNNYINIKKIHSNMFHYDGNPKITQGISSISMAFKYSSIDTRKEIWKWALQCFGLVTDDNIIKSN